jgi:hypothetical protein
VFALLVVLLFVLALVFVLLLLFLDCTVFVGLFVVFTDTLFVAVPPVASALPPAPPVALPPVALAEPPAPPAEEEADTEDDAAFTPIVSEVWEAAENVAASRTTKIAFFITFTF